MDILDVCVSHTRILYIGGPAQLLLFWFLPLQQFGLQNSRYLFLLHGKEEVEHSLPAKSE